MSRSQELLTVFLFRFSDLGPDELPRILHVACRAVPEPRAGRLAAGTGSAVSGPCWKLLISKLLVGPSAWTPHDTPTRAVFACFCFARVYSVSAGGESGLGTCRVWAAPSATAVTRRAVEVNVLLMLHKVPFALLWAWETQCSRS